MLWWPRSYSCSPSNYFFRKLFRKFVSHLAPEPDSSYGHLPPFCAGKRHMAKIQRNVKTTGRISKNARILLQSDGSSNLAIRIRIIDSCIFNIMTVPQLSFKGSEASLFETYSLSGRWNLVLCTDGWDFRGSWSTADRWIHSKAQGYDTGTFMDETHLSGV